MEFIKDAYGYALYISSEAHKQYLKLDKRYQTVVINNIVKAYKNGTIEKLPPLKGFKTLKRISHKGGMRILIEMNPQNKKEHIIRRIDDRKVNYQFLKNGYGLYFNKGDLYEIKQ